MRANRKHVEVVELDEDETDLPQKDKRKSSQMQRDQSHRKASGHNDEDDEDETEESLHTKRRKLFDVERDKTYEFEVAVFVTNEKKVRKFELLSKEAQNLCIKAVSRLFLFRGTKQEVVSRANILDTLAKIDSEYKTHCDVILEKAQELVLNLTGYLIIDGENIKGCKSASKTDYYLVNTMESSILRSILAEHEDVKRHALNGFAFAVYHSIFNSPGYAIQARDLLQNIRKLDGRFPETSLQIVQKSSSVSALSVPELQSDFLGLLQELRKEHYVEMTKDKQDPDNVGKQLISFGPRFYLEIGKKRLMRSYYAVLGQPVDERSFKELDEDESDSDEAEKS